METEGMYAPRASLRARNPRHPSQQSSRLLGAPENCYRDRHATDLLAEGQPPAPSHLPGRPDPRCRQAWATVSTGLPTLGGAGPLSTATASATLREYPLRPSSTFAILPAACNHQTSWPANGMQLSTPVSCYRRTCKLQCPLRVHHPWPRNSIQFGCGT